MRISEISNKAERLVEQGEAVEQRKRYFNNAHKIAQGELAKALVLLEQASETDEEGNPVGDIGYAQSQVDLARMEMARARMGLDAANNELEAVKNEKINVIIETEKYNEVEQENLRKLEQLQQMRFGGNTNAFIADLVSRMNEGEETKDRLLQSLGLSPANNRFSSSGTAAAGMTNTMMGRNSSNNGSSSGVSANIFGSGNKALHNLSDEKEKWLYYRQAVLAIHANPEMSLAEKEQAIKELPRIIEGIGDGFIEDNDEETKVKTLGINTLPDSVTSEERHAEILAERDGFLAWIAEDDSLTDEQKQKLSDAIIAQYDEIMQAEGLKTAKNPVSYQSNAASHSVREKIIAGQLGEKDIRDIGRKVRENYEASVSASQGKIAQIDERRRELARRVDFEVLSDAEREAIYDEYDSLREQENAIRKAFSPAKALAGMISAVRPVGPLENDPGQAYIMPNGFLDLPVKSCIENARNFLPAEWIEKSNNQPLQITQADRGYFISDGEVHTIALSGKGIGSMQRCAYHELGHHFEELYPEIRKLEHEFYQRRTAGEKLKWLGIGYDKDEKTRFDEFIDPYMGKDYGNTNTSGYELFSMGMEALYSGSYDLNRDPEYRDFIIGILASI